MMEQHITETTLIEMASSGAFTENDTVTYEVVETSEGV